MTDNQYLLTLTACFCYSLRNTLLTHRYSDFLFQLCLIRGSFQCFHKTFSTVTLAIVLDVVLGYHDGNLQSLWSIARMSDAYHYDCRPYKVSLLTFLNSWVSGLYGLSERWLISFKLCVGCWGHLRLDYFLVSPTIYHGKPSLSRCIHFLTSIRSWYKRSEFGLRIAIFFSAATLSGAFGGLLAVCRLLARIDKGSQLLQAAISNMDGVGGKAAWSWIFSSSHHFFACSLLNWILL